MQSSAYLPIRFLAADRYLFWYLDPIRACKSSDAKFGLPQWHGFGATRGTSFKLSLWVGYVAYSTAVQAVIKQVDVHNYYTVCERMRHKTSLLRLQGYWSCCNSCGPHKKYEDISKQTKELTTNIVVCILLRKSILDIIVRHVNIAKARLCPHFPPKNTGSPASLKTATCLIAELLNIDLWLIVSVSDNFLRLSSLSAHLQLTFTCSVFDSPLNCGVTHCIRGVKVKWKQIITFDIAV